MKTYHYLISGRVQGVCFRHYTVREAENLAIRARSGTWPTATSKYLPRATKPIWPDLSNFYTSGRGELTLIKLSVRFWSSLRVSEDLI